MKIGLLIQRATDLKWAGPFSQEVLSRKHQPVLIVFKADTSPKQAKAYLAVDERQLQALSSMGIPTIKIDNNPLSIKPLKDMDAIFVQEGYHSQNTNLDYWQQLRGEGVKIYSLSHFFEICKRPLEALHYFDGTIYVSRFARDLHLRIQSGSNGEAAPNSRKIEPALSSPMFDQFVDISREESRAQLGFSHEEKIVLLIAPVILPTTPWRFHVWRDRPRLERAKGALRTGQISFLAEIFFGDTFRELIEQIHDFCEQSQAQLIVKSRGKQKNLNFVEEYADRFVDGLSDQYFPEFSTYQLMAATDLCITVNSMAAMEAAAMGIPCINISVPHHDRAENSTPEKEAYNLELMGGQAGGNLNFDGAVRSVDRRNAKDFFKQSWSEVSFTPSSTDEYGARFLGIEGESSSSRILDYIEARV